MTHTDSGDPERRRGATTAQLRDDIQSGRTGDKVAGFDPAASPLGTDDEAGGNSPTPDQVALARAQETSQRPADGHANAATPDMQPDARVGGSRGMMVGLIAGLAAAVLLAVLLFANL